MNVELARPRVLLVDDIEENLIALEALLRRLDVELVCARSGPDALEHLLVSDFALALLDVNMPEMDGFQLAEAMRGNQRTHTIPIIFVTAAAYEPQRAFKGYETGAVDFLFKPIEPRILLSKVQTFITMHQQQRQLAHQLAELERMTDELEQSLRLHETFVAALNHDLRTPLHAISLGASMLIERSDSDVARRIASASDRMERMLDELYDVARMRLGEGLELRHRPGDLEAIVRDVVREAELRRGDRAIALEIDGDTRGEWDLSRLARIAANLISNALAHGDPSGPVRIAVDGASADEVRLAVWNAGEIPAEVLPRIFEPFRRGKQRGSGLGLGLYIVRAIASAHGGVVSVTSTAHAGTRFEVRLPRRRLAPR